MENLGLQYLKIQILIRAAGFLSECVIYHKKTKTNKTRVGEHFLLTMTNCLCAYAYAQVRTA